MKKRSLSTFMLLLTITLCAAQNGNESSAILDKTYANFKASEGIRLSFTTSSLDKSDNPFGTQKGEAYIKGDKFKLEMEEMDVWFNGKTQWILIKEVNEVNISEPTGQEIASISPLALLSIYRNGYTLEAPAIETVNGKSAYQITMKPTGNNPDFTSVIASVDRTSHALLQVVLNFPNGTKTQIDITKYNANYQFSDAEFSFDEGKHPGVEIVDLR